MSSSGGESGSDQSWKQMWGVFESLHREACRCYPRPLISALNDSVHFSPRLHEFYLNSSGGLPVYFDRKFAVNAAELR